MRSAGVGLAVAVASCAASGRDTPAERPRFEGARAQAAVEAQVAFGPRVPGTPEHDAMRAWLVATLDRLASKVEEDRFTAARVGMVNVVARFRPDQEQRVMLFAHWDTRPRAEHDPDPARREEPIPGANDGASGVAVLLELARLFHASPPALGVDLVFLDGEDFGTFEPALADVLLGAQRFAKTYRGPRPRFGILLDMVGDRDLRIPREQNSEACCVRTLDKIWALAKELGHGAVFVEAAGPSVLDDHIPLNRAALGVVDLIDIDYPSWHTTHDTPDKTSAASLGAVGEVLAELIYGERLTKK